jgi:hypothetical protein
MDKNAVLSYSPDEQALVVRHKALRKAGMKVVSVLTPAEARFEIQMGRCGSLVICYRLSTPQIGEITSIFRRYCPGGRIAFVTDGPRSQNIPEEADGYVPESNGPQQLLQALQAL